MLLGFVDVTTVPTNRSQVRQVATMLAVWLCMATASYAQRVRFPNAPAAASPPTTTAPTAAAPGATNWAPPALPPLQPSVAGPSAVLDQGIQPFDPYATNVQPPMGIPTQPPPVWTAPANGAPAASPTFNPYANSAIGAPGYPAPQSVPVFPEGFGTPGMPTIPGTQGPYQRLFQDTGATYTWLYGKEGAELQMHEVDISTSMVFQRFAHTAHGLRVTPGFTFYFLDGPQPPLPDGKTTSLPSKLYAAYLDSKWAPRLTPQFSLELGLRVGVYSDGEFVSDDSVRWIGGGSGILQLTPTLAFQGGYLYIDRLQIKGLPILGFIWKPNKQTNFEIVFPDPRLSQYWTTVGNCDLWWYIGAEYGGGNWTIERETVPLIGDRVDINDIRVFLGTEWHGLNERRGFFEIGYVFEREIRFYRIPSDDLDLTETIMLRTGLYF